MSNKAFIAFIIISSLANVALMFCFFIAGYNEGRETCQITSDPQKLVQSRIIDY